MEYVKSQKDILDNEEYEKLKYKMAKDGLAEIKLINENWKTRLDFLQEESGKKTRKGYDGFSNHHSRYCTNLTLIWETQSFSSCSSVSFLSYSKRKLQDRHL